MEKDLISIIVTVYNRENYIRKCLDSALNQKDVNVEIVIIDDGSIDATPEICDEYAEKYPNIRVIHEKNGGLSVARNTGLDNIRGDYIVFLDDDDNLPQGSLSKMLSLLKKHDVDFVMGNYAEYDDDGNFIKKFELPKKYHNKLLSKREVCEFLFYSERTHVLIVSWGKLFKKDVWDDIRFPDEIDKSEDQFIFHKIMDNCTKIYFTDDIVYNQVMSRVSITRKKYSRKNLYHAEGIIKVIKYLMRMGYYDIAVFKFGLGTRFLIWIKEELMDEECKKEIKRLIKLYRIIAKRLIPYVNIRNKIRFILFVLNFRIYTYFQKISEKHYIRRNEI